MLTLALAVHVAAGAAVTYAKDIAPLVAERCAICHHDGGSAPFPLVTYDEVKRHAAQIAAVTRTRFMPPWKADPDDGPFVGQHPLSRAEIAAIQKWVDNGAPEGDTTAPPLQRTWTEGWQLGTPDLVVTIPQPFRLQADGTDVFRIFVIPLPIDRVRFVRGLEFRPGNARVSTTRTSASITRRRRARSTTPIRAPATAVSCFARPTTRRVTSSDGRRDRRRRCCRRNFRGVLSRRPTSSSKCTCSRAAVKNWCSPRSGCTSATARRRRPLRSCVSAARTSIFPRVRATTSSPIRTSCRSTSRWRRCSRTRITAHTTCAAKPHCPTARLSR